MSMDATPLIPESPKDVRRYSARLVLWGGGAAVLLMFMLISTLTPTPNNSKAANDALEEQEIARLKQQKNGQKNWFDEKTIPKLPEPIISTPYTPSNTSEASPDIEEQPTISSSASEYDLKVQEEREKASLEMERFKQRLPLTRMQQKEDGIRSPLQVISPAKDVNKQPNQISQANSISNQTPNGAARITDFAGNQYPLSQQVDPTGESYDTQNAQYSKGAFLTQDNGKNIQDHYVLDTLHAPVSPYEIKAGTVIPAALITGINSDLPGQIIAQVREQVFDTVSGNYLLIPQGAKLIGRYDSQISFGQDRALVVWNRLIMPDGKSIDLESMQGVDIAGYAGFHDRVNNHYLRIYGNALLMSLVGGGYELLANPRQNNNNINDPQSIIAANVGLQLAQLTNQITRRNINIQPTIEISQGYRFNVMVMKDLVLEPR
jgi:type IV secretory pathway VirB10-like protein